VIQRVLRDTQATLEVTFYSGLTPTNADGAVTVDVARADGTLLADDAATTPGTTGQYKYTLAPQATLELLTLTWSGVFGSVAQKATTQAEIVGGYYVSLVDLQAESGLANKGAAELAEARQWFEEKAESWCGVAFVPRFARDLLDGNGSALVRLHNPRPRTILSAKIDGVAQSGTATWDLYETGDVIRDAGVFTAGRRNLAIAYEHGFTQPDADVREAALVAIRARLLGDSAGGGIPSGVTQLITDAGTYNFGRQTFPTGLPEVDAVLREHRVVMVG
jgi:hypothetical protein